MCGVALLQRRMNFVVPSQSVRLQGLEYVCTLVNKLATFAGSGCVLESWL